MKNVTIKSNVDVVLFLWLDFLGCWPKPRWEDRQIRVEKFCFSKSVIVKNHDSTSSKVFIKLFFWNLFIQMV